MNLITILFMRPVYGDLNHSHKPLTPKLNPETVPKTQNPEPVSGR
jgi:hypothetical protein